MDLTGIIFKDRSLWFKLTLLSLLPVLIVTALIVFKVLDSVEKTMIQEAENKADALTDLTRLSMSHTFVIYNKDLLDNFVDGLKSIPFVSYAFVLDSSDDRILAIIIIIWMGNCSVKFRIRQTSIQGRERRSFQWQIA